MSARTALAARADDRQESRSVLGCRLLILLGGLLVGLTALVYPFGRDQGIHAFIADALLRGEVPYRDVFNVKPPLTTPIHAAALLLFGPSMTAIRLLDLLWTLATALALYRFGRLAVPDRRVGLLAALLYFPLYYSFGYWHTAQTDGWANLPLIAALCLALRAVERPAEAGAPESLRRWALAGACLALAVLLKYTLAAVIPLLFAWSAMATGGDWSARLRAAMACGFGFLLPCAAVAALLGAVGALGPFIEIQLFLKSYTAIRELDLATVAGDPLARLARQWKLIAGVILIGLVWAVAQQRSGRPDPQERRGWGLVLLWLAGGYGSALLQGKFFGYHLLPLLPPLALLGAAGLLVLDRALPRRRPALRAGVGGLLIVLLIYPTALPSQLAGALPLLAGTASLDAYWRSGAFEGRDYSLADNLALVDYVRAKTAPGDRLYLWGYEPSVGFLSGRRIVSRFLYNFPLSAPFAPEAYRQEFMAALRATPPTLFIVQHGDAVPHVTGDERDSYATFRADRALYDWVLANYRFETAVGRFDLWRRR